MPNLPNPVALIKQAVGTLFRPVPFDEIPQDADFAGVLVLAGDAKPDGQADGRIYVLRRGEKGLVGHLVVPPENVPLDAAIEAAVTGAHLLPEPYGAGLAIALSAAGGAAKLAQKAALKS